LGFRFWRSEDSSFSWNALSELNSEPQTLNPNPKL